jgi:putative cell wall-binding protein
MRRVLKLLLFCTLLFSAAHAQESTSAGSKWGPNDTLVVRAIIVEGVSYPYSELEPVYLTNGSHEKMLKQLAAYNRLRNAVYVTYPYARLAGATINDINARMISMKEKSERKKVIKSKEKELRQQFTEPLTNLSVYQGKVLMKLVNRQTGNNCYEIIKEYKGGLQARLYQTVAFFFGSSLKQPYDWAKDPTDSQIEMIVREIDATWYDNPYRPDIRPTR